MTADPPRHRAQIRRTKIGQYAKVLGIIGFQGPIVTPAGLEPATLRLEVTCSIQLSYGAKPHPS